MSVTCTIQMHNNYVKIKKNISSIVLRLENEFYNFDLKWREKGKKWTIWLKNGIVWLSLKEKRLIS